jgi:chromosome segregation ATPase
MARQAEESVPASDRTDELPALSADAVRRLDGRDPSFRAEAQDALDRSLEALRETLDAAQARWHQLESKVAEQDRAIRELKDELRRARADRFTLPADTPAASVPELTEIVMSAEDMPSAGDPSP